MPVPFGFSVGINAFSEVCFALRDHGGAASEYQDTLNQLEGIKDIVESVKNVSFTLSTDDDNITKLVQALANRAGACHNMMAKFINRVKQYEPTLGSQVPQGYNHGTWSKAKWALYFSPELDRMRQVIGTYASSIMLSFLYLHTLIFMESFKQQEQLRNYIEKDFATMSANLNSNHKALQDQNTNVLSELQDLVTKVVGQGDVQLNHHEVLMRTLASVPSDIFKHLSELNSKLDQLLKQRETWNIQPSSSFRNGLAWETELPTEQQSPSPATNRGNAGVRLSEAELHSVLRTRARNSRQKLYWESSIVDLLKLLGLDSGIYGRKLLAQELCVNAGQPGSSAQNMALHEALMRELAEHGGNVPANIHDLLHT
ncbi:hypothetical protein K432DRAFT_439616 [Lepidopterella palustris CBS 459.81]|uniref:DUF3597 domain-containing protein n=1 Tax=Lepidopterella palustris CBS 459.81 TaxID=1314670 RepID=A0A8E2EK57_9PEZI|nr:hypothetical protein K432DRAFT_439616 [Lepidopterella palustris CBS 459.81]